MFEGQFGLSSHPYNLILRWGVRLANAPPKGIIIPLSLIPLPSPLNKHPLPYPPPSLDTLPLHLKRALM